MIDEVIGILFAVIAGIVGLAAIANLCRQKPAVVEVPPIHVPERQLSGIQEAWPTSEPVDTTTSELRAMWGDAPRAKVNGEGVVTWMPPETEVKDGLSEHR